MHTNVNVYQSGYLALYKYGFIAYIGFVQTECKRVLKCPFTGVVFSCKRSLMLAGAFSLIERYRWCGRHVQNNQKIHGMLIWIIVCAFTSLCCVDRRCVDIMIPSSFLLFVKRECWSWSWSNWSMYSVACVCVCVCVLCRHCSSFFVLLCLLRVCWNWFLYEYYQQIFSLQQRFLYTEHTCTYSMLSTQICQYHLYYTRQESFKDWQLVGAYQMHVYVLYKVY